MAAAFVITFAPAAGLESGAGLCLVAAGGVSARLPALRLRAPPPCTSMMLAMSMYKIAIATLQHDDAKSCHSSAARGADTCCPGKGMIE